MSGPHASEVPGDAVPRFDAGIAFVIAALAPVGAVAAAAAIPEVDTLRNKEQGFIAWAFAAAVLFFMGVAFGVVRGHAPATGVRARSIFFVAALYAAVWEVTFALYGAARSSAGTPLLAIMGLLLGAPAGAAFAALVAIRPSPRLAPALAARLGVLAAIPCAAFLMAWSLGSAFAFGGWRDVGSIRPHLAVVSLILGAGCALLAAPLLRALTMPADRL